MFISTKHLSKFIDISKYSTEDLYNVINSKIIELDGSESLVNATNLVIGHVESKEKHPDADKLNVCKVNVGEETLQIVCGAKNVDAGQNVIVALVGAVLPGNFKIKKSKIRGVESFGMICSLSELGIEDKFLTEEDKEGIKVLSETATAGNCPIKELNLDTHVFELGLTPNRMDLLSYEGFAYDLAASLDVKVLDTKISDFKESFKTNIKVVNNSENCNYYSAIEIKDLKVTESTNEIKAFLIANGIKPTNNIVDATNVAMLETGCPLHAFDKDKIGEDITIRESNGEKVTTLDDKEIKLSNSNLVITSNNEVIAVAGVIGSSNSKVDETTTTIVLEGAHFNDSSVRKTSSSFNVRTDASVRFERKVNRENIVQSMNRVIEILNGNISNKVEVGTNKTEDTKIQVTKEFINGYLGTNIESKELVEILNRLNITYNNEEAVIPKHRLDLTSKQDITEEVARIYGFENIPSTLPTIYSKNIGLTAKQKYVRKVRDTLISMGLEEVKTYSLVSEKTNELFKTNENSIKLLMPLSDERKYLRNSMIPSIVDVVEYNSKRNLKDVSIFEIGDIYDSENQSKEITIALNGSLYQTSWQEVKGSNFKTNEKVDFYTLKGILEELLNNLGLEYKLAVEKEAKNFHPGRTANIIVKNQNIGILGQLHPEYLNDKDLKNTYVLSIDSDKLFSLVKNNVKFNEVPKYPFVKRDLAVVVNKEISIENIKAICKKEGKKVIKNISIFDVYTGENLGKDLKSVGINFIFGDLNKTLETEEVNNKINKIIKKLETEIDAKIRQS